MVDLTWVATKTAGTVGLFAVGWCGYLAAKKLHWPSPALLGSLVVLGLLNLSGVKVPFFQAEAAFWSKVMSGVILAQRIDRGTLKLMKKMPVPLAVASLWMVAGSIGVGLLLFRVAGDRLSLMTCLASSSAGGIAEMTIFAMSSGADVGIVAFFQSARIMVLYLTLPFTAQWLSRRSSAEALPQAAPAAPRAKFSLFELARFGAVTCAGSLLFRHFGVPSGVLLGAMCGGGLCNLVTGKALKLRPKARAAAQVLLGVTICAGLSPRTVALAMELFGPLVLTVALVQASSLILAWVIHVMTGWDVMTSLLSTCPGGLSQVVFLAEDLGANTLTVGVFHAVRMVSIVVLIPLIAGFLAG